MTSFFTTLMMAVGSMVLVPSNSFAKIVPDVGFFPTTFPRDPIEFGKYGEQTGIGQVLETLISADENGELSPLLAESWTVSADGRTIKFKMRPNVVFSNGKILTADDALFSIQRHWRDPRSQSHKFLDDIETMEAPDSKSLIIHLKRPRVAIFKVLSRDQLGILPEGWTFDSKASEPFSGTGPYRLVREGSDWFYVANAQYRVPSDIGIAKWRLIRTDSPESLIKMQQIPQFIATADERLKNLVVESTSPSSAPTVEEQISFLQTSIWWYPHGTYYKNADRRRFVMGLMRELVALRRTNATWTKATGLIPIGVSGYLPEAISFPPTTRPTSLPTNVTVDVHIAIFKTLKPMFFADDRHSEIEKRHNVRFHVLEITEKDLPSLPARSPDIAIDGWFGGFNDPEGFLPLLPSLLGVDLEAYLEDIQPIYARAMVEQDWKKRAEMFRTFNRMLVEQERIVPTWRVPTFAIIDKNLRMRHSIFRYTPRLTDVVSHTK